MTSEEIKAELEEIGRRKDLLQRTIAALCNAFEEDFPGARVTEIQVNREWAQGFCERIYAPVEVYVRVELE